jgi:hypothetical protein
MKVGDIVMFNNIESKYAKWFYGQIGIVKSYSFTGDMGQHRYCRVTWLQPVKYFDSFSTHSDFKIDDFEVFHENR